MKGGQQNAIRSELVYHDYSGNFSNSGGIFERSKEVKGMFVYSICNLWLYVLAKLILGYYF